MKDNKCEEAGSIRETKYLRLDLSSWRGKTAVYAIVSKKYENWLGVIEWYAPWRQYCFRPDPATIWNKDCLMTVVHWTARLNREHKLIGKKK